MKCKWEDFGERDDRGWRRVRCTCCGITTSPTPHPFDKIHSQCQCWGLGDCLAYALSLGGITSERVSWLLRKQCDCAAKQEQYNDAGVKLWKRIEQILRG